MENAGEESRSLRESSRLPEGQQNRPENPDAAPLVEREDFAADVRSDGIAKRGERRSEPIENALAAEYERVKRN